MNSSTAAPALTISMTLRGRFSRPAISSMEWAPMTFLWPLAASFRKSSTLETVRLKATTVYPWSLILRIRFWPMTASPINAMSAVGSMMFSSQGIRDLRYSAKLRAEHSATEPWRQPASALIDRGNSRTAEFTAETQRR